MDKEREKRVGEHSDESPISKNKLLEEEILKTDTISVGTRSSNESKMELATFKSLIIAPEYLSKDMTLKDHDVKYLEHSKTSSSSSSPKLLMNLTKSMFGVTELLEAVNMQTEETEEMLDMILRAKEKLEFFISHVECLLKSLTENFGYSATNVKRGNTYVKNIYRKKLEEFASCLLGKVKRSINYLEVEHETLKELGNKLVETSEKISESNQTSNNTDNGKKNVISVTVDQLLEEIRLLKSKQLSEIEKVSYIETDIEMLYDLYRRFSSIEGPNSMNDFNFM